MKQLLLLSLLLLSVLVYAQEPIPTDYLAEIKANDVSDLWTLSKFKTEFDEDTFLIERMEPLGYIGENYQRFYIRFISVIQHPNRRLDYFVYGKTRVKNTICPFQGLITINEAKTYYDSDLPLVKQGFLIGNYVFYEDNDRKGSGSLEGKFRTDFYVDKTGKICYNSLLFIADGFKNNQFEGTWIGYNSSDTVTCNWGDFRIPDSKGLDVGAGRFAVSENYVSNGWIGYMVSSEESQEKMDGKGTIKKSKAKWWIEKE